VLLDHPVDGLREEFLLGFKLGLLELLISGEVLE
jgi:hypothetical protein